MYKKAWCTCKVVVLLMKPIVYLTFSLPSASLNLKVPVIFKVGDRLQTKTKQYNMIFNLSFILSQLSSL